jgi:tight adherence protein B
MSQVQLLAGLVFIGVVAVVYGAYWLLVLRQEQRLLQRVSPRATAGRRRHMNVLKAEESMSSVGAIDYVLRTSKLTAPVQNLLDSAGMRTTVSVFLLLSGCAALLVFVIANRFVHLLPVSVVLAVVGGALPYFYASRARRKRLDKFEEQFPEAVDLIARALRAGHGLASGLGMVADELAAPVGTEFRILYDEQNFGLTLPDAMRNFARRVPVLDAKFFVTAVLTQRETGGNLAEVLDNLGSVIRERFKVKRQVRVLSAHGRITGWVLAMLPPVLALATLIVNPGHLGVLLNDPIGQRMIVVALILQIVGTLVIRKLVDVEY